MPENFLGQVRRSQVLGYGPGAIIDFRAGADGGAAVSVIGVGLEFWDRTARMSGLNDPHRIFETRLQHALGKKYFRLPPIDDRNSNTEDRQRWLEAVRFPTWLQCIKCGRLQPASKWSKEFGDPTRWCPTCSSKSNRVHAVPTRFVVACENGHLDDFPWMWWLRRQSQPRCTPHCSLRLKSEGKTGLSGLILECTACGARASMDGVFGASALAGLACRGHRPWLGLDEACTVNPRALQRGAANLYFPALRSALSIPPWEDWLQEELGIHWDGLLEASEETKRFIIRNIAKLQDRDPEELFQDLERRIKYIQEPERDDLKRDEYLHFMDASEWANSTQSREFSIVKQQVPKSLSRYIERVVKVDRLREVRVQTAFKRVYEPLSPTDPGQGEFAKLSALEQDWLPAVEVRGEGIFLALNARAVLEWEELCPAATARAARINEAYSSQRNDGDDSNPMIITARFILVHTLAHAVIRQLAMWDPLESTCRHASLSIL